MPRRHRLFPCVPVLALALALALGLTAGAAAAASAVPLVPARHGDFGHYTFALTWQPGFCSTDGGCLRGQPRDVLIGLHGLWAARPRSLIERRISAPQWWRHGCDYYHHSDRAPRLPAAMLARLDHDMPHLRDPLLKHEYDKHVQCFGFDTATFFRTELGMRRRVLESAFGRYLIHTAQGRQVRHEEVIGAFMRAFGTRQSAALQLRCGRSRGGEVVLTQLWFTLHTDSTSRFPRGHSLMNAPIPQDNCPQRFWVPRWP